MARKFIATVLAASLAVAGLSAPARAQNNNDALIKFLAGATALVIIGKAIESHNSKSTVTRHEDRYRYREREREQRHERHRDRDHDRRNRHDSRDVRYVPDACRTSLRTRDGVVRGYSYRCVQQYPRIASRMPGQCVTAARSYHGTEFLYATRCLAREGYRVY